MKENLNREELSAAISDTRKSFDTDNPIIPFIEGDGIGIDIWPDSQKVFDSAVEKAYNNQRSRARMAPQSLYEQTDIKETGASIPEFLRLRQIRKDPGN